MERYIQIDINFTSEAEKDMLVARLADIGFEGFQEERHILKAFIPEIDFDEELQKKLQSENEPPYSKKIIEPQNWNEAWEASFDPVTLEDFCTIRADFHTPVEGTQHEIIITPKMSFGTGHHATTLMMLYGMREIDFSHKRVLDFGTGTGVLAILAEKMGASSVMAIDNDEWSIENAKENLDKNHCERVSLHRSDFISSDEKFDVILVNINKNILLNHMSAISDHLAANGLLLVSGILAGDLKEIIHAADDLELRLLSSQERNSWSCMMSTNSEKIT